MNSLLMETLHFVFGKAPVADFLSGTVRSDVVNLKLWRKVMFVFFWGVGTTGTTTITVEASDDVTPTTTSAVPFRSRRVSSPDTAVASVAQAAAGFVTTAGSNQIYIAEVDVEALLASGYNYVSAKAVESVDDPILGGILIIVGEPRATEEPPASIVT